MKKLLAILIATFALFSCIACGNGENNKNDNGKNDVAKNEYSVYMPDGAPALAMAKLIKENMQFDEKVTYKVVSASDIGPSVIKKTADVAILPVTAASKAIGGAENYVMLGVVTHGNLYVMSSDGDVDSDVSTLKGKTIGVIGQGQVPDLTFKMILKASNIEYQVVDNGANPSSDKVGIRYFGEASDMLPEMKKGMLTTGLLPEPAATKITTMNNNVSMKIDIQEAYGGDYPQAVLVVKKSIIENDLAFVEKLVAAVEENAEWVKSNAASAVDAINKIVVGNPSLDANVVNEKVVAGCNIYLQLSGDAKASVNEYLSKVRQIAPDAAKELSDSFFYELKK